MNDFPKKKRILHHGTLPALLSYSASRMDAAKRSRLMGEIMKRMIVLVGVLFALTLIFRDQSRFQQEDVTELAPLSTLENLPDSPSAEELDKSFATEVLEDEEAAHVFFPKAKVIASVSDPERDDGSHRVIENVETAMRNQLVRVERILQPSSDGGSRVVEEVAMVANQLLLQKPYGMAAYIFLDMLSQAGALEVKELEGNAYLATFDAQPGNPRALDSYTARVQELAGVEIAVEPNYLSKIF